MNLNYLLFILIVLLIIIIHKQTYYRPGCIPRASTNRSKKGADCCAGEEETGFNDSTPLRPLLFLPTLKFLNLVNERNNKNIGTIMNIKK